MYAPTGHAESEPEAISGPRPKSKGTPVSDSARFHQCRAARGERTALRRAALFLAVWPVVWGAAGKGCEQDPRGPGSG